MFFRHKRMFFQSRVDGWACLEGEHDVDQVLHIMFGGRNFSLYRLILGTILRAALILQELELP